MNTLDLEQVYEEMVKTPVPVTPVPVNNLIEQNSLHLADVTVKAVDQIGEHAAKEVEALAAELRKEAESVALLLDDLAAAMREHSIQASQQVAVFVKKTTHMAEVVRGLEVKLKTPEEIK
jgi:ABC-type transporter Mla subunit MlaD